MEWDLGVWVDGRLDTSPQRGLQPKGPAVLGCPQPSMASRMKGAIAPLCVALGGPSSSAGCSLGHLDSRTSNYTGVVLWSVSRGGQPGR